MSAGIVKVLWCEVRLEGARTRALLLHEGQRLVPSGVAGGLAAVRIVLVERASLPDRRPAPVAEVSLVLSLVELGGREDAPMSASPAVEAGSCAQLGEDPSRIVGRQERDFPAGLQGSLVRRRWRPAAR